MSFAVLLKNNLKNIHPSIGSIVNYLPYQQRPGIAKVYKKRREEIIESEHYTVTQKQEFVYDRIKKLVDFAYNRIDFYKGHYDKNGFSPNLLKTFEDINKIPMISKEILREYDIEKRSAIVRGRHLVNTGGSSGIPLSFYIQPDAMGHEWAHIHTIWSRLGYKQSDLKFGFGGRTDMKEAVSYDVVRNQFLINTYLDYKAIAPAIKKVLKRYKIKYLHGYPSLIYEFAEYCRNDEELLQLLQPSLQGALLGSEYPHKVFRDRIEETFNIKSVSWYGHTERAVLAYEKDEYFNYCPFLTYGFAEAVPATEDFELVATAYYNYASPLIRYNTGDLIGGPDITNGILNSFKITRGREGEFVIDKAGNKISLTALIFGRHHEIFNHIKYLQLKQVKAGVIEVYYVGAIEPAVAEKLFDKRYFNFDYTFIRREEPIRTPLGKMNLLVK